MARSFNYTKRKEIAKSSLRVVVSSIGGSAFSAAFDLAQYDFDPTAKLYVEAYRKNQLLRFDFGTVGAIAAPRDTSLAAFGDDLMGIRFRTKVVAANADKTIRSCACRRRTRTSGRSSIRTTGRTSR